MASDLITSGLSPTTSAAAAAASASPAALKDLPSKRLIQCLQNELLHLMLSPTPGISAFPATEDDLRQWVGTIEGSLDTFYQYLAWRISIKFPNNYPFNPPLVSFITPMWHPNIDIYGGICLDILHQNWTPVYTIRTVLLSIQSLLSESNHYSLLNMKASKSWRSNPEEYREMIKKFHEKGLNALVS